MITTLTILVIYLAIGVQLATLVEKMIKPSRRSLAGWLGMIPFWLPAFLFATIEFYWLKAINKEYER